MTQFWAKFRITHLLYKDVWLSGLRARAKDIQNFKVCRSCDIRNLSWHKNWSTQGTYTEKHRLVESRHISFDEKKIPQRKLTGEDLDVHNDEDSNMISPPTSCERFRANYKDIEQRIPAKEVTAMTAHHSHGERCANNRQDTNKIQEGKKESLIGMRRKDKTSVSDPRDSELRYLRSERKAPVRFKVSSLRRFTSEDEPWTMKALKGKKVFNEKMP